MSKPKKTDPVILRGPYKVEVSIMAVSDDGDGFAWLSGAEYFTELPTRHELMHNIAQAEQLIDNLCPDGYRLADPQEFADNMAFEAVGQRVSISGKRQPWTYDNDELADFRGQLEEDDDVTLEVDDEY